MFEEIGYPFPELYLHQVGRYFSAIFHLDSDDPSFVLSALIQR